jgi:glutamyl/glutaminyl-tRNA synthetase
MSDDDLLQRVAPILQQKQVIVENKFSEFYIKRALSSLKPKIKKMTDFADLGFYFFKDPEQYDEEAIKKYWQDELVHNRLKMAEDRLSKIDEFDAGTIESTIRNLAEESGISAAKLIHPIRLALTGFAVSPGLFELMEILGKETVLRRINNAVDWITEHSINSKI